MLSSLAMIALVRDAEEVAAMRRAIESARSIVDEVVLVLDERSVAIDKVPATVHRRRFESFSDQRNFAADQCSGEWVLCLDADDFFEDAGDLRAVLSAAPADAARVECIEATVDEHGEEIEVGTAVVAYRRAACRWKYRGHNWLVGGGDPDARLFSDAVMIYRHPWDETGYDHARRTIPLLLKDYEDDPNDPHGPYFLARAHYMLDDYEGMAKWADATIRLAPDIVGYSSAWFLLVAAVHQLHGVQKAWELLEIALKAHPMHPDLLDLATMFWSSRWRASCELPGSPYLKTHLQSPRRLPYFEESCRLRGWNITRRSA